MHVFLFLYLKLNQLKLVSCKKKNAPASDTGIRFLYSFKVRVSGRQTASDLSKYPIFHDQKKIFFIHGALPLRNNNFELVHVFLFLYLKLNQLKLVSCKKKNAPASDTGIRFLYSFKVRVSGRQTASDLSKYPIFHDQKKMFFFHGALPLRNNNFELVNVFLFLYLKLNQLKLVSCKKKNAPASDTGIRFLYSFKVRVSGRQTASDLSKYPIFHDQKKIFFIQKF